MTAPTKETPVNLLAELVDEQASLYFEEILPRLIDRHFRGAGYVFLHALMQMHDERRVREPLGWPEPSARSRTRSRRVRELCPLALVEAWDPRGQGSVDLGGGTLRLGQFQKSVIFQSIGPVAHSSADAVQSVELYEAAFLCLGLDEAGLREELLQTIFHEYIHYFESFLRLSEQPLAGRERGASGGLPPLTLEAARRRDRWHRGKRLLALGVLCAVIAVSILAALAMNDALPRRARPAVVSATPRPPELPPEERERRLVHRVRAAAALRPGRESLETIVGTPAVLGSALRPGQGWVARIRLEPDGELPRCPASVDGTVIAWVRPQHEVFPVRLVGVVYPAEAEAPLEVCFATVGR